MMSVDFVTHVVYGLPARNHVHVRPRATLRESQVTTLSSTVRWHDKTRCTKFTDAPTITRSFFSKHANFMAQFRQVFTIMSESKGLP